MYKGWINMPRILELTIFGLNREFYIKYLIHGLMVVLLSWILINYIQHDLTDRGKPTIDNIKVFASMLLLTVNALLYPYARYLYGKFWNFFSSDSTWYVGGILLLLIYYFKLVARLVLFSFAIFIAPIAWINLYFENSKYY